jgi:hypothetical protein
MSLARCCARTLALCSAFLLPVAARAADADPGCATAYAKGQDDRLAGRLFDARTAFKRCSVSTCPDALVHDCATWVSEVEADLPTVVIHVTDAHGRLLPSVRVLADGNPIAPSDLERPLVLEAGPHSLRFEAAGYEAVEVQTALRPTDRQLEVRATLYAPGEKARAARPAPRRSGVPTLSLALAGVGAVALGTSAYFGIAARRQYDDLEQSCAPYCRRADADAMESKALISDIALGTSLVALGAAAWIFFGAPDEPKAAVVVSSRIRGGDASVRVTF